MNPLLWEELVKQHQRETERSLKEQLLIREAGKAVQPAIWAPFARLLLALGLQLKATEGQGAAVCVAKNCCTDCDSASAAAC